MGRVSLCYSIANNTKYQPARSQEPAPSEWRPLRHWLQNRLKSLPNFSGCSAFAVQAVEISCVGVE